MMISIERQIADMAAHLPDWTVELLDARSAVWIGSLQPYTTRYTIRIEQRIPYLVENRTLIDVQPLIEVLSPKLMLQPGNPEGDLPHVYWSLPQTERAGPFLCVFDAEAREWTLDDPLSHSIVPFTLHWLQSYEGWLACGDWLGFGRHTGGKRTGVC
ncbi:hypothetical protein WJT74_06590 [Sphingomicrobium sp. XHP0239]|uniref:hypothetical protein n=1 Tax=Sphingomicrobium maritimum TaxID=3133972 RepID=UPI0031CC82FB